MATMERAELEPRIRTMLAEVYREQNNETFDKPLGEDAVLLDLGLDSLGFAILVTRLEEELGYDPFTLSDESFYPATFGEFVTFYHENAPG